MKKQPNVIDLIKSKKLDLVINIPKSFQEDELTNDYMIRRGAVDHKIPLMTNRQLVMRLAEALENYSDDFLQIKSWDEYQ